MNPLLVYMIKAAVYLAAFYMVFSFLLSRDTLYNRNRTFILLSVFSALLLPLITIQTNSPVNLPFFGKTLSEVLISSTRNSSVTETTGALLFSGPQLLMTIYFTGLLIFGGRFLVDLSELILLISRKKTAGSNIIRFNGFNTAGFSALGYVFINSGLSAEDADEITKHEQNHLDHYHFFDIVFIEIVKVLQWFNPFIHMFNRSLRAVHEFQADEGCLNKGIPVVSYQQLLMNQLFKSKAFSITNRFSNPTLIKKRMIMMTKERSRTLANLKLLMVAPVIAIVMIAFSSCGGKTNPAENTAEEIAPPPPPPPPPPADSVKTDQKVVKGEIVQKSKYIPPPPPPPPKPFTVQNGDTIWQVVENMPIFHGGDAGLLKFIGDSTNYPAAAKEKNIQGRVIVKFVVTANGEVEQGTVVKGVNPELDAEAVRVVNLLPKFEKPGYQHGKPVPVWYMIPITFTLK